MKRIFVFGAITFGVIQLLPNGRSNPPVGSTLIAPPEITTVLKKSCYDCHSNETVWPWISKVAPVSWLVASDVNEGREELNFSTWGDLSKERQAKKLRESWSEISEGEMPVWTYLLMHRGSGLTDADKELLHKWILDSTTN